MYGRKSSRDSDNPVGDSILLTMWPEKAMRCIPHKTTGITFTQSLRYAVGMDRFAVTTDITDDKRDKGSSRWWTKIEQLQGFTNGACWNMHLYQRRAAVMRGSGEYHFRLTIHRYHKNPLSVRKPRTQSILNRSMRVIGLYPYKRLKWSFGSENW